MNQLMSDGGDCRTAPATPGLLMIVARLCDTKKTQAQCAPDGY